MGVLETTTWKAKRALLTINLIVEYKPQIGLVCFSPPPPPPPGNHIMGSQNQN